MKDHKEKIDLSHIDIEQNISDFAHIIERDYIEKIDRSIKSIEDMTSVEIAIITIDTLEGRPIDEVALELFNKFGIGKRDYNNGILLLVSKEENQFRIEIGIGLEGILSDKFNDALANKVISPGFYKKQYGSSILKFVGKLSSRIRVKGFSNLSIVSWLSGVLSLIFGLAGIFSSSVLALTSYIDINRLSSLLVLFLKTTSPAIALALAAIVCGTLDLIREEDYPGGKRYSSRSITGIILGVATLVLVTIIFFIFGAFVLFLADAFSLSSGSY